ncbi:unnamed protein product, partial [Meganyctiphanes norvegica]
MEVSKFGEQPIFSCKAHVFHIDPKTKRSWIPASSSAVSVSFFYDSTRQLYRIISVEGTKAVINSTITPNMMFTKTSQKFGQWSDMRANTVYGLGFSTENELNKFIEKFQEVKEATRSGKTNGTIGSGGGGGGGVVPPQGPASATASPLTSRAKTHDNTTGQEGVNQISSGLDHLALANSNDINATLLKSSLVAHQRSQSLSGLQPSGDSPKHKPGAPGVGPDKPGSRQDSSAAPHDSQVQLKYENDRLKLALAQSSANAKKWEIELNSLKTTNARLTSALQESTANVEEWKKQLQTYKEENNRMKARIHELEAGRGGVDNDDLLKEVGSLRARMEGLEEEIRSRDNTIDDLTNQLQRVQGDNTTKENLREDNEQLRLEAGRAQSQLEVAMATQDSQRGVVESVNMQLGERIKKLF